jgi:predicted ATPase
VTHVPMTGSDSATNTGYDTALRAARKDRRVMINSLRIRGYRTFEQFEMGDLGRVNLLVGRNNTGKTSILEGLFILASGANLGVLWQVLARRGEQVMPEPNPTRPFQAETDISHLFFGHELAAGKEFVFSTTNEKPERSVRFKIDEAKPEEHPQLFAPLADETLTSPRLALWTTGTPDFNLPPLPISRLGTLRIEALQQFMQLTQRQAKAEVGAAQFITTESLAVQQIAQLWNSIVLTPDEDRIVKALQILEGRIERIAQVQTGLIQYPGQGFSYPTRGGFYLRLSGDDRRVPIGSFGDGMWRMLAIAVALVRAKDNLLLIDEIDTGLHYTVMADMWKLVYEAANLFNVQVFATTHSYDCVHSLATICAPGMSDRGVVTIQRIEQNKTKSVPFSESEIKMAADRQIEIR